MTAEEVVRSGIPAWIRNDADAGNGPDQFNSPAAPMEF